MVPGVVDPAEVALVGLEGGHQRIAAAVVGGILLASAAVEEHVDAQMVGGGPSSSGGDVSGRFPESVGRVVVRGATADSGAGCIAVVRQEVVVDVGLQIIALVAEVGVPRQPVELTVTEQLALEVVLILVEGLEHRLAPVGARVDPEQGASARSGDQRVDVGPRQRRRLIGEGGLGRVGVDRQLLEVGEHARAVRGQGQAGTRRKVSAGGDAVHPEVAAGRGIGGHLADRELVLKGLKRGPLSGAHADQAGDRDHDTLVVRYLCAIGGRRRQSGKSRERAGPPGCRLSACGRRHDRVERDALAVERVLPILIRRFIGVVGD